MRARTEDVPDNWATVTVSHEVLLIAHNVTTLNRIADIVGIFQSDRRLQLTITSNFADPFADQLSTAIAATGIHFLDWEKATATEYDLIVSASHHGDLQRLHGPIVIFSHGTGFTKYAPEEPGADPVAPVTRSVFGLSRPWLMKGSELLAAALVLSHPEQVDRLAAVAPEALPTAVTAGDPCFDRILDGRRFRRRFRAALGVDAGRRLVVLSSTWSSTSMLGLWPDVVQHVLAELPVDSFQIAMIAHPNVWYRHGPGQLESWLAGCRRAGLVLIPPDAGWQAAIIAADCVIGDHGSVTAYAAAIGTPTLLAAFPERDVVPGTAVDRLGRLAPRLRRRGSLRRQIREAIAAHRPDRFAEVADLISSVPGESPQRLRRLCYEIMRLPELADEAVLMPLTTAGLTAHALPRVSAMRVWCDGDREAGVFHLERTPVVWGHPASDEAPESGTTHAVVHHAEPARGLRRTADVVFGTVAEAAGATDEWLRETLADHPHCALVAVVGEQTCLVRDRAGRQVEMMLDSPSGLDPSALASAAQVWTAAGRPLTSLPARISIAIDGEKHPVSVRGDPTVSEPAR
jgi:hypothetical protein